jgi:capsular exopolysaccharide synthesis family protein
MEDVSGGLGLRIVGSVPVLPSRVRGGRALARNSKDRLWHNLLLESIDAVRTMLVHAARSGSHRVVMITSAEAGEGKTSLASHLATSLARCGHATLLIDADLRNPSIHRLFDLPPGPGLGEVLRGEAAFGDVIAASAIEDLKVMTAGGCDERLLRNLARGDLGEVFAALKGRFDFVIVDSSPILPVADASIVAQQADAVLLSIFQERSRKAKVLSALQRLDALGVEVLGAVVTGGAESLYGNDYYRDAWAPAEPSSTNS